VAGRSPVFLTPSQKPSSARRIFRRRIVTGCRLPHGAPCALGGLPRATRRESTGRPTRSPARFAQVGKGADDSLRTAPGRICSSARPAAPPPVRRDARRLRGRAEVFRTRCARGAPSARLPRRRRRVARCCAAFSSSRCVQVGSGISSRRLSPLLDRRALLVPHFEKMLYDNASPPFVTSTDTGVASTWDRASPTPKGDRRPRHRDE